MQALIQSIIDSILTEGLTDVQRNKILEDAYAWATTLNDADLDEFICDLDCRSEMYYSETCPAYAGARALWGRLESLQNSRKS